MAFNTLIQQGSFSSDGKDKIITMRSDVDWVKVYNLTNIAGTTQWAGTEWFWQREMANNDSVTNYHAAASQVISTSTSIIGYNGVTNYPGISLIDSSANPVGALDTTITAVSNAAPPVATLTSTAGLNAGDIVRMINIVGGQQLGGIDFTIGNGTFDATHFSLDYMATIVAGTTGSFRKIDFDPLYYPRKRFISAVTSAASAVVTLTVTHGYTIGQKVRFSVPAAYGMTQLDNLQGTITAISTANNTVTVDINSSAFTAFAFPLTAAAPFTQALMMPIGECVEVIAGKIPMDDATYNTGYIGFKLGTSATAAVALASPGGTTDDAIKWMAGKSFNL
jgi:hypothetical protein